MKPNKIFSFLLALLLLTLPLLTFADTYTVPDAKKGNEGFLSDGNEATYLTIPAAGVTLSDLPEGTDGVWACWFTVPNTLRADFYDADGVVVRTESIAPKMLNTYLPLDGARGVRLSGVRMELAELVPVADASTLPFAANNTKADVVLLLSHLGDETLVAAPVLKALTDYHLTVQVGYLYKDLRDRKGECIRTLRALGITREPYFFDWQKPYYDTVESAQSRHDTGVAKRDVNALLRTCAPALWISDGIGAGAVIKSLWPTITEAVQKHYILSENGPIPLTMTDEEAAPLNAAYKLQSSRLIYRDGVAQSVSLQLLTDGADDELLSGIATDSFLTYASPTPVPTPTPEPTPTPTPTPEPTPAPTDTPSPVPATEAPHYEDRSANAAPDTDETVIDTNDAAADVPAAEAPRPAAGRAPVSKAVWVLVAAAVLAIIGIGGWSLVKFIRDKR